MTIRVNDPAMGHLTGEVSVVIGDKEGRICIHPRDRTTRYGKTSSVAVSLGSLKKDGGPKDDEGDWELGIFDRADFVEGLLAVFPELVRR